MSAADELSSMCGAFSGRGPRHRPIERGPTSRLWRLRQRPRETIQEAMARAAATMPWASKVRGEPRLLAGWWCWAGRP